MEMDRVNLFSDQVYLSVDCEGDDNTYTTKPRILKSEDLPGRIYTLRFRNNLKEKLDDQHELQFQMQNQNGDNIDGAQNIIEHHADRIVSKMEEDPDLMENNLESEKLRKNVLKHMPQSLTLKRSIKRKLTKSVNRKQKGHPISSFKRLQYRLTMKYYQMKTKLQDTIDSYELWYSSLKTIEGHFGSATSSYFRFLRWLFLINLFVMAVTLLFIVVPQLTFRSSSNILRQEKFKLVDILTGEGFLTDTLLYYGFYSNETVNIYGFSYNMPYAFFYTMLFLYVFTFLVLSYGVANSYRKSFIETEGGLRNVFAHKIFCGWDFGIATREAADLKSTAIYNELKEFLSEIDLECEEISLLRRIKRKFILLTSNVIILVLYTSIGVFLWFILQKHTEQKIGPVVIAVTANVFNVIIPILLTKISRYENYRSQKNAIGITLIRSFILGCVIVGTLVTFWLIHSFSQECWETSLGQEMYRLILYDFLFCLLIHVIDLIHRFMSRMKFCEISPSYEFDIASNTLDLIYSQSLFWMGFFFSPLLSIIVTIRMFLTWHLKKFYVLKLCKPSTKAWRAYQTQTWFLTLTFLTHLATGGSILFILLKIPATNCGPFQGHDYIYQVILLQFDNATFIPFRLVAYLIKPGVISLIIIALCARVYYVREKANAQRDMVKILRNMLVWEAKDKKFLLQSIANVTKEEYQYEQEFRHEDPYTTMPRIERFQYSQSADPSTSTDELITSSKFGC
ncbi:transmembrane channel-like protein 5 [Coccinella septempunctata]|uniref:transmembrane channel-like protein 5 n=1 Tax=Coccinella septempunctata TaxID=41139 RepID=UPI001D082852|nr:transmembrane channel-like protein 5 [Coccinella septempunctata]